MRVAYGALETKKRSKKPSHYRDHRTIWYEIIRIILDGKCTDYAILKKEHSGYWALKKHLNAMIAAQLLEPEQIYNERRIRCIDLKYSVTEKGARFYVLMGHLMEACPKR
jgi:predicted transcriptional regulator